MVNNDKIQHKNFCVKKNDFEPFNKSQKNVCKGLLVFVAYVTF